VEARPDFDLPFVGCCQEEHLDCTPTFLTAQRFVRMWRDGVSMLRPRTIRP
jgi:hypothetical protein